MITWPGPRLETPNKRPCKPETSADSIGRTYPFLTAALSVWYGKIFRMSRISRLKIQRISIVPPMPIKASVQPKVQVSIASPCNRQLKREFALAGLFYDSERLFGFDRLTGRNLAMRNVERRWIISPCFWRAYTIVN